MKSEELRVKLAQKVRGDSKYLTELTSATALAPVQAGMSSGNIEAALIDLVKNDHSYRDIKSIASPMGKTYFYSAMHMSECYARILARVKDGDPCLTIAETVRDESRIYPRVTNVELFKFGLFKIDRGSLDEYIAQTMERYSDIRSITSWPGSVYLYSNRYLTLEWAELLAQKKERPDS